MITPEEVKAKLPERFWSKVKFAGLNECWEWQRGLKPDGYGSYHNGENKGYQSVGAHRYLFKTLFGEMSTFIDVLHKCDNRKCVNPNHLFIGNDLDNMRDRDSKGRNNQARGEDSGTAKLTAGDVFEIKERMALGENKKTIALDYDVTVGHIERLYKGVLWRHLKQFKDYSDYCEQLKKK